ncbi:uncharacterized protein LOC106774665 [Vigna radiata var. radiata]|uniref:Uncharacterized protein LOC106774665 n=1 Tax=Vigna radiata var. radiata TaxID=3916 RepID=A0A3Q0FK11_VIGRR|nr:uncharacterized protein LOC106774665 [Vigna radiata var. radiata]
MEGSKCNWRLRTWMESSYIVEMNALLRDSHCRRISTTPFKWCLDMVRPLDISRPLLKEMLSRWVGMNKSFIVRQQMVPFNVVDVLMSLGLGLGGLDVPYDESVCGLVGEMFNSKTTTLKDLINMFKVIVDNDDTEVDVVCRLYLLVCFVVFYFPRKSKFVSNMPCIVLDDLDSLDHYDWTSAVHKYIVRSLNKCSTKILKGRIVDSVSISGNVAVLQLWAFERLKLHARASDVSFPRVLQWSCFKLRSKKIQLLFQTKDIYWDWYLCEADRRNPLIRAAFHLDERARAEGPIPKGGSGEGDADNWKNVVIEKLNKNNTKIKKLKERILALRKELDGRKAANFEEKRPSFNDFGADDEVEVNEEAPCEPQEHPRDVIDIEDVPSGFPPKLGGTVYSGKSSDDASNARKDGFKDNENIDAEVLVRCKNLSNQSSSAPTADYKSAKRMSPQAKLVGKDTVKPLILKEDVEDANGSKEARLSIEGVSLSGAQGESYNCVSGINVIDLEQRIKKLKTKDSKIWSLLKKLLAYQTKTLLLVNMYFLLYILAEFNDMNVQKNKFNMIL